MIERVLRIEVDGGEVAGALTRPENCRPEVTPGLVLAHGANNDLSHPLLVAVATYLAETGAASVLRFNFPYMERGASTPDRPAVLEAAFRRAHDALMDDEVCPPGRVFLGGKSLGARVAAELVSRHHEGEGLLASGLVFLGYPLHAPGHKDRLRFEPLRRIDVPSLFVEGTRDPFCDLDLLRPVIATLDVPGTLHVVEGGGHSLELPRSSSRTLENVYSDVAGTVARFISEHAG
jgi:hypothetical protein